MAMTRKRSLHFTGFYNAEASSLVDLKLNRNDARIRRIDMDIALFKMKPNSYLALAELSVLVAELRSSNPTSITDVTQVVDTIDFAIEAENTVITEKLDLYLETLSDSQIIFLSFLSDKIKNYRGTYDHVHRNEKTVIDIRKR